MSVTWPDSVNDKFYGFSDKPVDNYVMSENISGRVVGYKRNSSNLFEFTCNLKLDMPTELNAFWNWFNNTLGGLTGKFTCSALGNKVYRFTSIPEPGNTDRKFRLLSLEIAEVY